MKKTIIIFLMVLALLFIYGCEQVVCNPPYIAVGRECCLDTDSNNICDKDEEFREGSKIVITEKEPQIVEKKVTEYVCSDGSVVNDKSKCPIEESTPIEEEVQEEIPELVLTNEENTVIKNVTIKPACIRGLNGGEIFFNLGTVPSNITVQVKEGNSDYGNAYTRNGLSSGYITFAICDSCRGADFKLKPGRVYIMRMMFDQTKIYKRFEYSNEHLVDARDGLGFMLKLC